MNYRKTKLMCGLSLALLLALPLAASEPTLPELAAGVSEAELKANITALVGFGTRHSASDTLNQTRGIGAARRWAESRFEAFSAACGNCLTIIKPAETVTGPRLPTPTEIVDVLAIQPGTSDPDRFIIMSALGSSSCRPISTAATVIRWMPRAMRRAPTMMAAARRP